MDIMKYFDTIIGYQEAQNPKPHPEPIFKALENLNTIPSKDVFMIGDTKLDLIAARDAKVNGVGVLCGYGQKDELLNYTNLVSNNSLEAVKIIKDLIN